MATTDPAAPKWHGALKETINVPADKAWAIVGTFCGLDKWLKTINKCEKVEGEYQQPGCVRYMVGNTFPRPDADKSWAKEKLVSMDEKNYSFSYAMLESNFGLEGYVNHTKLQDLGNGTTAVDWSFSVNPVEGKTEEAVAAYMTSVFSKSLKILEDLINSPSS